ncbi:MAG: hypothetical protein ACMG6H_12110, partial [Acidobacteriota bacterium]
CALSLLNISELLIWLWQKMSGQRSLLSSPVIAREQKTAQKVLARQMFSAWLSSCRSISR